MAVRIKICGITRMEDLKAACAAGADALGFVFCARSPRNLSIDRAAALVKALPPFVQSVGLFVDAEQGFVEAVLKDVSLGVLQFHGDEDPVFCRQFGKPYLKAIRVREGVDLVEYASAYGDACGLLLDAFVPDVPGGSGERFDWRLIPAGLPKPIVLSGGLTPENVTEAVRQVKPWAVDVSSGVEAAKGIKDAAKLAAFIENARCAAETDKP
ncbi:MAG: phosphoribosylanthranilate isomerase [Thiobacillaceae bacterium]|jgi:phosphoribosylanthranilate isomerase